jgi:hypothetical protein
MQKFKGSQIPAFSFETDFTLTQNCHTGIIKAWHHDNLVGAKL